MKPPVTEQALLRPAGDASVMVSYQEILDRGSACGGKARTLALLAGSGIPVPAFFVVRDVEIVAPAEDAPGSAWQYAQLLDRARIDDGLLAAIEREAGRLMGTANVPVAVRSSSQQEDARTSSFAGQFRSFLGVSTTGALVARLRQVWASGYLRRAAVYRDALGIDSNNLEGGGLELMPVIVQWQVPAVASGVVFTRNPANPSQLLIEAVLGTGESLVSGRGDPDRILVDSGGRRGYTLGLKDEATLVVDGYGSMSCPVPPHLSTTPALTERQVDDVVALARSIERLMRGPSDIEFAVDPQGTVWIVQARPITT